MARQANALHYVRDASESHYDQAARLLLAIAGSFIFALGTILAAGGLLSPFSGSPFYVLAGSGLAVSGALVAMRRRAGAWLYMLVLAGTLLWSLRNMQLGGSSLALRLAGPAILLFIFALLMPVLCRWRPRQALIAFAAILAGITGVGVASATGGPLERPTAAVSQFLDAQTKGLLQ